MLWSSSWWLTRAAQAGDRASHCGISECSRDKTSGGNELRCGFLNVAQHWHNAASSWMGPTRRILALARLTTVVARLSTANVLFFFTFHFCYFCCCRFCKCCLCCCFCLIKRILTLDHLTAVLARFSLLLFLLLLQMAFLLLFVLVLLLSLLLLLLLFCRSVRQKGFCPHSSHH